MMTRFQRLTWNDLGNYTRGELLPRVEAEEHYWQRKEKRGLSQADQQARREFTQMLYAVSSPAGLASSMAETTAWLKGERATPSSYFNEKPGRQPQPDREARTAEASEAASSRPAPATGPEAREPERDRAPSREHEPEPEIPC
jgi:hypothetical protein